MIYTILVPVSLLLLDQVNNDALRFIVSVLPVIPVPFMIWAMLQYLHDLDELQRRIHLEAFAISLGATGMLTFTLGFLENAGGPELGMIWVLPMIIIFWGMGQIIARRRYE